MQGVDKNKVCACGSGRAYDKCCKFIELAESLREKGRYAAALTNYRQAITLKPDSAIAYNGLGFVLEQQGKLDEAILNYQKALSHSPNLAEAHFNLGSACDRKGNPKNAIACYQKAAALNPDYVKNHSGKIAQAYFNLAIAFELQEKFQDAMSCYQQVLAISSEMPDAFYNYALLLRRQGRLDEAIANHKKAINIKADYMDAYYGLGESLLQLDKIDEAVDCYNAAFKQQPGHIEWLFQRFAARVPALVHSVAEINALREQLFADVDSILLQKGSVKRLERAQFHLFNLAYHGVDDRFLMEQVARLVCEKAPAFAVSRIKGTAKKSADGRIRIAFLSNFFWDHTIGKLTRGYIRYLDRSRFHVTVIHAPGGRQDAVFQAINVSADQVLMLPDSITEAQSQIALLKLDILHYPDIGMSSYTYMLAFSRLAPVQTVAWGHPLTTGLKTIDYYLSFSATEPEDADDYFTETVVRLNRAPYCEPEVVPADIPSRVEAGLPETGTLYGCVQSLYKYHPDFDAVMAKIIQLNPQGWIIAFEGTNPNWSKQLRERWQLNFPRLSERVIFIARQPLTSYLKLIANLDIFLDTVHFGSGMTFYQSLAYGIPTVTCPGKFMRGRFVSGIYRWLGIQDAPIVEDISDYAAFAVAYAADPVRCANFKQQMQEKISMLYNDELAIREYENFFEHAVRRAEVGEKLINWDSGFLWPYAR